MSEQEKQHDTDQKKPGLIRIIASTMAGAFGVQSQKNRERDFQNGNIWVFVVSGIIFTLLFIFTVTTVVRFALS